MGLYFNDERSDNGYTLFSNNETTYLIDNCGYKINDWQSEYKSNNGLLISPEGKLIRQGQMLAAVMIGGGGGIIERYSWEGDLEWSYVIADEEFVCHHDMTLMPNGNLLLLVWQKILSPQAQEEGRSTPGDFYNEQIWELEMLPNNEAKIVWRWSALDHIVQDVDFNANNFGSVEQNPNLIDVNYVAPEIIENFDWLHFNSIDYNEELDQIIVSSRNTSEVYIIDHSTTTSQAAGNTGGDYGKGGDILYRYGNPEAYGRGTLTDRTLHQCHDVSWVRDGEFDGNFIIFNNKYLNNDRSRVQIWNNPAKDGNYIFTGNSLFGSSQLLWSFDEAGFYSNIMSSAQMLPNGNVLATEGSSGEMWEIAPSKERVWKYINPVNKNGGPGIQGGSLQFSSLFKSVRYQDDYQGFEGLELIPQEPIELSPIENDCQIFISTNVKEELMDQDVPFSVNADEIIWRENNNDVIQVYIFNMMGQLYMKTRISMTDPRIDISELETGIYVLKDRRGLAYSFYKF